MSFNRDCSSALHLLEHIQQTINNTDDAQLQMQTAEDINMLISVFSNPILRSIVTVEVGINNLCKQIQIIKFFLAAWIKFVNLFSHFLNIGLSGRIKSTITTTSFNIASGFIC